MNKVIRITLLTLLLVAMLLPSFVLPAPVAAASADVYGSSTDGHITATSASYATAQAAGTGTVSSSATTMNIGQTISEASQSQTAESTEKWLSAFGSYQQRYAQKKTSFQGTFTEAKFYLKKVGSPTGTGYARVWNASTGDLIGTIGEIDVSTIGTGLAWYTFDTTDVNVASSTDIRIGFEYSAGGDGSNYVVIRLQGTDITNWGHGSYYMSSAWTEETNYDATFQIKYKNYQVWRSFVYYDTSSIPTDATISAVSLYVYGETDSSTQDFGITVKNGQPTYPSASLVGSDYNITNYSGVGNVAFSTSTFSTSAYNEIVFDATGIGWINKGGTTKLALVSDRDVAQTTPTQDEYVSIYTQEQGSTRNTYLTITYSTTGPYFATKSAIDISSSAMTFVGEITGLNGHTISQAGFDYGTTSGYYSNEVKTSASFTVEEFSNTATELASSTKYYFRAKVYSSTTSTWYYAGEQTATTLSTTGGAWVAYDGGNPVLSRDDCAAPFTSAVQSASVVKSGGTWFMYFEGGSGSYLQFNDIGLATSSNGLDWIYYGVVLEGTGGQWDATSIWDPSVIIAPDGTWWMLYGGFTYVQTPYWGLAYSSDGISWTKHSGNPVVSRGQDPQLFRDPVTGVWRAYGPHVYYEGTTAGPTSIDWGTAHTISLPGISSWVSPNVEYYEGKYIMFYTLAEGAASTWNSVGMAVSDNGKTGWSIYNPTIWSNGGDAVVVNVATNTYYMYHGRSGYNDAANNWIAMATYSGATLLEGTNPTVSTNTPVNTGQSSTTLQGTITSLGDATTVYVSFEYGTSVAFGSETSDQTFTTTSSFSSSISGLSSGTTYYFRARIRTSTGDWSYGTTLSFATLDAEPGELSPPTDFKISSRTATSITLSWTRGSGSSQTLVRYSITSYPTSPTGGTQVYLGTGTTTTHSGLVDDTTYYYSAWGEAGGHYSVTYAMATGAPTADVLPPPDTLEIETLQIYRDYINTGDQLIVFSCKILWDAGIPTYNPEDFFYIQLLDGDIVIKQDRLKMWGYVPGSLYVSYLTPLEWNKAYTFRIRGTDRFSTPPEATYSVTTANYMGSNYKILEQWVLDLANRMQVTPYWDSLIEFSYGRYILSPLGAQIFTRAIPGLFDKCPDLFHPTGEGVVIVPVDSDTPYQDALRERAEDSHGAVFWGSFENMADMWGLEVEQVATIFWVLLYVVGVVIVTMISKSVGFGAICALPILLVAVMFGGISMAIIITAGIIGACVFVYKWVFHAG